MADFGFVFTEGSFLLLKGQKHLRSVAEDLISNKQQTAKRIYQKRRSMDIIKLSSEYFSTGHNSVWFLLGVWK